MWLRELIKEAQKAYEENGNIPVAVYADHGQGCELAYGANIMYRDKDDGESYTIADLSEEYEVDLRSYQKVFEIFGE